MKTTIPPWITKYFYSIETIDKIRKGNSKRIPIITEMTDFSSLLNKNESSIIIPKIIGIYQKRELADETNENKIKRKNIEAKRDKVIEERLLKRWGIIDKIHPDLIHIGYEPEVFTENKLRELLNDNTGRIGLSLLSSIPNFFEKDQVTLYEIMLEENKMYGGDPSKVGNEQRNVIRRKFIPRIEELSKQLTPFGLTRNEFYFIKSYYD